MNSNKKVQFTTAHELLKNPHLQSKTSKNIEIDKAISFYQKNHMFKQYDFRMIYPDVT